MALIINHNMPAMNAARNLGMIYDRLSVSTQRLSSGLRINSAADDAAGLAIREQMRADIAVLNQGLRNAADGISMIQTAEGALSVIDEKLTRMKELAEQASTGTYTTAQRDIMNSEYQAMAAEIDRIANATDFNGIKLLDGSISNLHGGDGLKIHFGTGNDSDEDYYFINLRDARATVSTGLQVGGDAKNDIWGTAGTDPATGAGGCCGGGITSLTEAAGWASGAVFAYGYNWDHEQDVDASLDAGKYIGGLYQMASGASLQDLVDAVNAGTQSRVRVDFAAGTSAAQLIGSGSGFSICIGDENYNWGTGVSAAGKTVYAVDTTVSSANLAFAAAVNQSGGNYWAMLSGDSVWVFSKDGGDNNSILACDQAVGTSATETLASRENLVTWYNPDTQATNSAGTNLSLGGYDWGTMQAVQTAGGSYGVKLNGMNVGAEYDLYIMNVGSGAAFDLNTGSGTGFAAGVTNIEGLSRDYFSEIQNAADAPWAGAEIRTQSAAQEALAALDNAIVTKDKVRADLGALQNRLENTMSNLSIQAENLQASESRISDVDVAAEMTEFTRNNIMAQAATSMLAQANSLAQLALSLLG
jgi:flagellin